MPDPMTDMPEVKVGPALSATSDVPVVTEAAETVDETPVSADTSETAPEEVAGEADTRPQEETQEGGEETDKTSPQQRAAFARERNRRQALEARLTAIEQQNADLIKALAQQPKAEPPKPDPRPQRLDFNSPDAFEDALVEWKAKEVRAATEAQVLQRVQHEQLQARAQAVQATFSEREATFGEAHPDYMDVTRDPTLKVTPIMAEAAYQIEEGPEVLYHLAQNPELAERLSGLTPTAQVTEIGRLAARLSAPPAPEPRPAPKPTPIRPIGGRSGEVERSLDDMSMDEWHAKRSAERKAAGIKVF